METDSPGKSKVPDELLQMVGRVTLNWAAAEHILGLVLQRVDVLNGEQWTPDQLAKLNFKDLVSRVRKKQGLTSRSW